MQNFAAYKVVHLASEPLLDVILPFPWRQAVSRALKERIQRYAVATYGRTTFASHL